jgi:hypothetical protein
MRLIPKMGTSYGANHLEETLLPQLGAMGLFITYQDISCMHFLLIMEA